MDDSATNTPESDSLENRLFIEELCCDLCRFRHAESGSLHWDQIKVSQEYFLDLPGAFADICIKVPNEEPYFLEVKYGYSSDQVLASLGRKYSGDTTGFPPNARVVVVLDKGHYADWPAMEARMQDCVGGGRRLEVWDEAFVREETERIFGVKMKSLQPTDLSRARFALDREKSAKAFGDRNHTPLRDSLLWHFGYSRLLELRDSVGMSQNQIMSKGLHQSVVVVFADLCSFSSYVRDTPDEQIVQDHLFAYYAKTRYQIITVGGMLYQYLGDGVIALFGLPDQREGYVESALECAKELMSVGTSIQHEWQRRIDRVQETSGVHIGMALGDVRLLPMTPLGQARISVIADAVNIAARLSSAAGPGEIVVSNSLCHRLSEESRAEFEQIQVEAKNVGSIRAWRWSVT